MAGPVNQPSAIKRSPSGPTLNNGSGVPRRGRVASEALFCGQRELRIVHAGQEYRLFVTRKDKLILTK